MSRKSFFKKERVEAYDETVGYVTKTEVESIRRIGATNHPKSICKMCDHLWFYKTLRCPSCGSPNISIRSEQQ